MKPGNMNVEKHVLFFIAVVIISAFAGNLRPRVITTHPASDRTVGILNIEQAGALAAGKADPDPDRRREAMQPERDFSLYPGKYVLPVQGWWEYALVAIAAALAVFALVWFILGLFPERENHPDHIKYKVLAEDFDERIEKDGGCDED